MFLAFESFRRSPKPNNYLIAPEGLCQNSTPDQISSVVAKPAEVVFRDLVQFFSETKGWKDFEYDEENHRISVVAVTPLLRFKDDVDIRVLLAPNESGEGEQCQLAIYSRSRVGYSDLGANKKRVASLMSRFEST